MSDASFTPPPFPKPKGPPPKALVITDANRAQPDQKIVHTRQETQSMDRAEKAIRKAYKLLSPKRPTWVRLADLRPILDGDQNKVTTTLLAMCRTGYVHLAPDSDRRHLTDADRAAAIRTAGEDNHLLYIED